MRSLSEVIRTREIHYAEYPDSIPIIRCNSVILWSEKSSFVKNLVLYYLAVFIPLGLILLLRWQDAIGV